MWVEKYLMSDLIHEFITLQNGGSGFKLRAWGFYSTERFSILDTLCIRNAGLLQNQHPAHVWHQRIAALNVISIHSNQVPERGRRATVFVPAHLCVPAPSASPRGAINLLYRWWICLKISAARRFQCHVVQSEEEIATKNWRVLNIFQISAN